MPRSVLPWVLFLALLGCEGSRAPGGQVTGGCRYTRTDGRCRLSDVVVASANSDDPNVVAVRATYGWVGDEPAELRGATKLVEWTVPRSAAAAAQAHARAHADVACWVAVDKGGCPPDGPKLADGALPAPSASP